MDPTPPNPTPPPPDIGEPPLHRAARLGDADAIRRLVEAGHDIDGVWGIDLNTCGDDCVPAPPVTPLMVAAGSGDGATVETLDLLISLGADAAKVIDGASAAGFAACGLRRNCPGGDAARLRFLLETGAPLAPSPRGASRILCHVARAGDVERLRVLLEHGLPPDGYWDADEARESHQSMMASLRQAPDPLEGIADEIRSAVDAEMAQWEQEDFERACAAPSDWEIPLFNAAASGSVACVRLLLDAGAEAVRRDDSDQTAMFSATSVEVIQELMSCGLSLEDRDYLEWTPLESALSDREDGLAALRALIACGADVNSIHDRGYTVFMSAVGTNRHPEALRLLVAAGADPHAVSELGYNAFHAAIDVDCEAGAEESVRDTLGYLKELGVEIELRNQEGHTPLARAIAFGTGIEVRVLCELGANPNAVCPAHQCGEDSCENVDQPLIIAAAEGTGVHRDEKVQALLEAGADPLAQDAEGYTALARAVAALCSDADDYTGMYQSFFERLHQIRLGRAMPDNRKDFVAAAEQAARRFVEQFAAAIPIDDSSEFEPEWRRERITCIVLLCAYEGWARHKLLAEGS